MRRLNKNKQKRDGCVNLRGFVFAFGGLLVLIFCLSAYLRSTSGLDVDLSLVFNCQTIPCEKWSTSIVVHNSSSALEESSYRSSFTNFSTSPELPETNNAGFGNSGSSGNNGGSYGGGGDGDGRGGGKRRRKKIKREANPIIPRSESDMLVPPPQLFYETAESYVRANTLFDQALLEANTLYKFFCGGNVYSS